MGIQSELSRIETLKSKITQFGVLESDEPAILGTGKIICTTCTVNMAALRDKRHLGSKFLAVNGGSNVDLALTSRRTEHTNSAMHRICYEHAMELKANQMTHAQAAALPARVRSLRDCLILHRTCLGESSVTGSTGISH